MKRPLLFLFLTFALSASVFAQDISPAEQRLRDTLRNTMLQLRTAQTERANLQADKIQNEAKIQQLESQVEGLNKKIVSLNKDAAAEQEVAKKNIDGLQVKSDAQEKQIAQLKEALEKWKAGYAEAVKIAKEREALRAKAVSKGVLAERKLAERERQNLELYETGSEVLERLQNFGLGTALTAREPFVGVTRVKLQNLVQDYGDRLRDSKYNPFLDEAAKPTVPTEITEEEKKNAAAVQVPQKP
ncbi:phage major capsid protein [Prosthecobacter dejongeii]|uniref:TolA-binding protein n=1 Tax=Prosthecobacter dejongeii TaxID=48465 RepID=A0A7W7YGP7_9BACT|nr:phage major capsid protein [Prosthecobacter dejongeii]MBB5035827.1 TolA-binding protein [Prosthecobacter dejongeii]